MGQREKMIELIGTSDVSFECFPIGDHKEEHEALADHLLEHGVVVLPCRCRDCKWYRVDEHQCAHQICMIAFDGDFCSYAKRKGGD